MSIHSALQEKNIYFSINDPSLATVLLSHGTCCWCAVTSFFPIASLSFRPSEAEADEAKTEAVVLWAFLALIVSFDIINITSMQKFRLKNCKVI